MSGNSQPGGRRPRALLGWAMIGAGLIGAAALALAAWPGSRPEPAPRGPAAAKPPAEPAAESGLTAAGIVARIRTADLTNKKLASTLRGLAAKDDEASLQAVMLLAREPGLEVLALEALGGVRAPAAKVRAAEFLKGRFGSPRPEAAGAAAMSYARLEGEAAVPELVGYIRLRWQMRDGYELQAASAGARALGEIQAPAAVAALAAELARVSEPGWLPDYGSAVVAALARSREPAARAALLTYAEALQARLPGPDNPPGRSYYQEKIAEARAAALGGKKEAEAPAPPG